MAEEFKPVIIHGYADGARMKLRDSPGDQGTKAFMYKMTFKRVYKYVITFTATDGFNK